MGQLGGFKHEEARDMLRNPEKYKGRVAKVKAMKVFDQGALFQPRFSEWHLDKGDIEKTAKLGILSKNMLAGAGLGAGLGAAAGGIYGYADVDPTFEEEVKEPTPGDRLRSAILYAVGGGVLGAGLGGGIGRQVGKLRRAKQDQQAYRKAEEAAYRAEEAASRAEQEARQARLAASRTRQKAQNEAWDADIKARRAKRKKWEETWQAEYRAEKKAREAGRKAKDFEKLSMAFLDEIEKIALALHVMRIPGVSYAGKLGELASRKGMQVPGMKYLGQSLVGAGFRSGAAGKPMISRPARDILGIGVDQRMVDAYAGAHAVGRKVGPKGLGSEKLRRFLDDTQRAEMAAANPEMSGRISEHFDLLRRAAVKAGSPSKKVDYLFKPLSEVASDIGMRVKQLRG